MGYGRRILNEIFPRKIFSRAFGQSSEKQNMWKNDGIKVFHFFQEGHGKEYRCPAPSANYLIGLVHDYQAHVKVGQGLRFGRPLICDKDVVELRNAFQQNPKKSFGAVSAEGELSFQH